MAIPRVSITQTSRSNKAHKTRNSNIYVEDADFGLAEGLGTTSICPAVDFTHKSHCAPVVDRRVVKLLLPEKISGSLRPTTYSDPTERNPMILPNKVDGPTACPQLSTRRRVERFASPAAIDRKTRTAGSLFHREKRTKTY
jgi:hypothetical protein